MNITALRDGLADEAHRQINLRNYHFLKGIIRALRAVEEIRWNDEFDIKQELKKRERFGDVD